MRHYITFFLFSIITVMVSGCGSEKDVQRPDVKVLLPLYVYPDEGTLQAIYEAAEKIDITVVVNPHNGQFDIDSHAFQDFIDITEGLVEHNVTTFGYVFTQYAQRPIEDVKSNILAYQQSFDVSGIFYDEVNSSTETLAYYQELTSFMRENTDFDRAMLNPGQLIDASFVIGDAAPASELVIFEKEYWQLEEEVPEPYVQQASADQFVCLVTHTPFDLMPEMVDRAMALNCGYVYVTDNGWDLLPSYFEELVDYMATKNR